MSQEIQKVICQNSGISKHCQGEFVIEPDDFVFYNKIKVPPPTFCPECRLRRRMAWRAERYLYKRNCVITGKSVITCFPEDSKVPIVDRDYWWSENFNSMDYGKDYDFSKPFFVQFLELMQTVPSIPLFNAKNINSPYTNYAGELKNGYLSFGMWSSQDVMYCSKVIGSKDSLDLYWCLNCEFCYDLVNCQKSYKLKYSVDCSDCISSNFLFDCINCNDCFMSSGLRNKSYVFRNQQLTKEEYQEKIKEIDFGSFYVIENLKKEFEKVRLATIRKYSHAINVQNSTGDYLFNVSNCKKSFDLENVENCAYCVSGGAGMKDTYDVYGAGAKAELMYEVIDCGDNASNLIFSMSCWGGFNVFYSIFCHNAENVFGCIGVHKKKYCILNKQYSKEEYFELVEKIKKHMVEMPYIDNSGRVYKFGEFFPGEICPYGYNKSIAQEYLPFKDRTEALEQGFNWDEKNNNITNPTVEYFDLEDNIKDFSNEICKDIISCEEKDKVYSNKVFKILPEELEFYQRMNIPIPRKSPNARHYDRMNLRNPIKLWHRKCMKENCEVEFETSYAPDRLEIVYCEKCYQQEVY